MTAGVYTYTVNGVAPCANATATVTVTENAAPNAGTNGSLTLCSNGAAVGLITGLGGVPAAGGAWGGPSPVVGGNYDPATMTAGVYTYTVNGVAPCANATATVTVTENAATNAGTNGTLTLCSSDASTSLFAQLGGTPQAGGTWSGPSPVVGGNYDPATMTAGVYTYTVNGLRAMRERHGDGHGHGERCAERRHERFAHALLQRSGCWVDHRIGWCACCWWCMGRPESGCRRQLRPSNDDRWRLHIHRQRSCSMCQRHGDGYCY